MSIIRKTLIAALAGAGALAFSAGSASAYVACSAGTCWHVQERHEYPAAARIVVHEDNWRWRRHEHFRWREHEGRGYWRGGTWRDF